MWQAMLTLGVALIGFFGVALGAVVTGFVTLRQAQLATQREREVQQMLREQERKDARDAFQRDVIIALQDAISAYWQLAVDVHGQVHGSRTEADQETVDFQTVYLPMRAAHSRVTAARAKVFDDELRRLVKDFGLQIDVAVSMGVRQAREALAASYQLLGQIEERVNALLRNLF
jgi:hypothetical protein